MECIICYESEPKPIRLGCACRDDGGFAHVDCIAQMAATQYVLIGMKSWLQCQTCKQHFTGAMQFGLGDAWWSRVRHAGEENDERLLAHGNLGTCLCEQGQYLEAERIHREVHGIWRRLLGDEHSYTLHSATSISTALMCQNKWALAEQICREVFAVYKREGKAEDADTVKVMMNLYHTLRAQEKTAESEQMLHEVYAASKRVHGPDDPFTLGAAGSLALLLQKQRKYAEAERINRASHSSHLRVLGPEHQETIRSMAMLAGNLFLSGDKAKLAESMKMFQALYEVQKRVLGPNDRQTIETARLLELNGMGPNLRKTALSSKAALRRQELGNAILPLSGAALDAMEASAAELQMMLEQEPVGKGKAKGKAAKEMASALSPAALVEAEANARAAEMELLAMLELEEAGSAGLGSTQKGKHNRATAKNANRPPAKAVAVAPQAELRVVKDLTPPQQPVLEAAQVLPTPSGDNSSQCADTRPAAATVATHQSQPEASGPPAAQSESEPSMRGVLVSPSLWSSWNFQAILFAAAASVLFATMSQMILPEKMQ